MIDVNKNQRIHFVNKVKEYFNNQLEGLKVGVWGLAFKPNTDDIREAPAVDIIREMLASGAKVSAYDPEAMDNVKAIYGEQVNFTTDPYDALDEVDVLLIVTEWNVFRTPDFAEMDKRMKNKVIFDGRNLYKLDQMKKLGFYYNSVGRGVQNAEELISE